MQVYVEPKSSLWLALCRIGQLDSPLRRTFLATEYCEDPEGDWWIAEQEARNYLVHTKRIIEARYPDYAIVELMEVIRRREWQVEIVAADILFEATRCIEEGFVWNLETHSIDMPQTEAFYEAKISSAKLYDSDFDDASRLKHELLAPFRRRFVHRKLVSEKIGNCWVVKEPT